MIEDIKKNSDALNDGETGAIEVMTDGIPKIEDTQMISETRVMERMTDGSSTVEEKKNEEDSEKFSPLKEVGLFLRDLMICMAVVLIITTFVVRPIQVKGGSMYPTLENGEIGVSNLLGYKLNGIQRFDIVIIHMEEKNEFLVKRAIGMPNETISYKDGKLYVDGTVVEEEFFDEEYIDSLNEIFMEDVHEITLGEDEYFCLGDNRPHSTDSRYYGAFKKEDIISKGVFIIFPFNRFGPYTW